MEKQKNLDRYVQHRNRQRAMVIKGSKIVRQDGSVWRIIEVSRTSDGFLLGTGILLGDDEDAAYEDEQGIPVIHSFFLGEAA